MPSVVGAVLLLFAGWVLARLLRAVAARGALLIDALLARTLAPRTAEKLRMGRSAVVLGAIVYWLVLLFFVAAARITSYNVCYTKLLRHAVRP